MLGINYLMWFDLSIEGKSPMDPEKIGEDKLNLDLVIKTFPRI